MLTLREGVSKPEIARPAISTLSGKLTELCALVHQNCEHILFNITRDDSLEVAAAIAGLVLVVWVVDRVVDFTLEHTPWRPVAGLGVLYMPASLCLLLLRVLAGCMEIDDASRRKPSREKSLTTYVVRYI